ncbi:MAG: hypothetical protein ACLFVH_07165, partial [Phycisphaerae bacterium]
CTGVSTQSVGGSGGDGHVDGPGFAPVALDVDARQRLLQEAEDLQQRQADQPAQALRTGLPVVF